MSSSSSSSSQLLPAGGGGGGGGEQAQSYFLERQNNSYYHQNLNTISVVGTSNRSSKKNGSRSSSSRKKKKKDTTINVKTTYMANSKKEKKHHRFIDCFHSHTPVVNNSLRKSSSLSSSSSLTSGGGEKRRMLSDDDGENGNNNSTSRDIELGIQQQQQQQQQEQHHDCDGVDVKEELLLLRQQQAAEQEHYEDAQNNMKEPLLAAAAAASSSSPPPPSSSNNLRTGHSGGQNSSSINSISSIRTSSYGSLLLGPPTRVNPPLPLPSPLSPPPPPPPGAPTTLQNTNAVVDNNNNHNNCNNCNTIRFQVVVWNIGKLDVVTGSVPMTFRVSLFWNDVPTLPLHLQPDDDDDDDDDEKTNDDCTVEEEEEDGDDGDGDDDGDGTDILSMDESSITSTGGGDHRDNDNGKDVCMVNNTRRGSVQGSVRSVRSFATSATTRTTTTTAASMMTAWKMHGRSKAIQQDIGGSGITAFQSATHVQQPQDSQSQAQGTGRHGPSIIEVPPLSILNVATFETIGGAEIDMLCPERRLFRWTAMYRATVLQKDVGVENFPHDMHDVEIKLAILSQRSPGRQWDSRLWKLDLATEDDSQYSTRVPYGLIVDQVKIPGFAYNKDRGLQFDFVPLNHGSSGHSNHNPSISSSGGRSSCRRSFNSFNSINNNRYYRCAGGGHHMSGHDDEYLRVSVTVLRESGYYDQNIVPLVALLNVVAVSVLTFQDTEFFYRALITLNIAFVEMSIRIQADGHLPSVGYQIKLQRLLNEWFVILMSLVLEGMLVYVLVTYFNVDQSITKTLDWITGLSALGHNAWRVTNYYQSKQVALYRLEQGTTSGPGSDGDGNDHKHLAKKTS